VFKTVVANFVLIKRPQMTSFDFPTTMPMMVLMHKPIHKPSLALDPWREKNPGKYAVLFHTEVSFTGNALFFILGKTLALDCRIDFLFFLVLLSCQQYANELFCVLYGRQKAQARLFTICCPFH